METAGLTQTVGHLKGADHYTMKILEVENGEVKLRRTLTDLQSLEKLLNICLEDGEIWRVGDTLAKSMNLVPHYEEEVCAKIQHHIFDCPSSYKMAQT